MNETRVRRCGPRVKTGCITCKIRRVKCGEEKPYCRRCTSTGRKCDGYSPRRKDAFYRPFVYDDSHFPSLSGDTLLLEQFCGRISKRISPFFELDNFWRSTIPQLAYSDSAVKSALVAITSVYDQAERHPGFLPVEHDACAVKHYNEAIRLLLQKDFSCPNDIFASVIVCILFICLEFIRGDMKVAMDHIRGGFKVLQQHRLTLSRKNSLIDEEFVSQIDTVLSNLRVQTIVHDPTLLPPNLPSAAGPPISLSSNPTLSEIRHRIMELTHEFTGLIIWVRNSVYTGKLTLDQIICHSRVKSEFHHWLQYLEHYMSLQPSKKTRAVILLTMHTLCMYIWTSNALTPGENCFDDFKNEFERLIILAEETVEKDGITHFQMESGLIPPLHFTAAMCRFPLLRRRALRILGSAHWREGLFDSHRAYRVTHKVMEIEERGLWVGPGELGGERAADAGREEKLPKEEARIHSTQFDIVDHGAKRQKHIFATKPNGLFNDFVVRIEWVDFCGDLPALTLPSSEEEVVGRDGDELVSDWKTLEPGADFFALNGALEEADDLNGASLDKDRDGHGHDDSVDDSHVLTSGPTLHSAINLQLARSWSPS